LIFAIVLATLVNQLFRLFLPIDRPFVGRDVILLFYPPQDPSFPSNHAFFASVAAFSLFFYQKKAGFLAILAAISVGLSRIFAGVHWPIDVLAGLFFGFLVVFIVKKILDRLELM
jgi:undecaprenyl-diphosphatase